MCVCCHFIMCRFVWLTPQSRHRTFSVPQRPPWGYSCIVIPTPLPPTTPNSWKLAYILFLLWNKSSLLCGMWFYTKIWGGWGECILPLSHSQLTQRQRHVKNVCPRARLAGFQSWLCHLWLHELRQELLCTSISSSQNSSTYHTGLFKEPITCIQDLD